MAETKVPRNNPLNIRKEVIGRGRESRQTTLLEEFKSMQYGIRAVVNMSGYNGLTKPFDTIEVVGDGHHRQKMPLDPTLIM